MDDEEKQAPANGELPKGHTRKPSLSRKPSNPTAQWVAVLRTNSIAKSSNFEETPEEYNGGHGAKDNITGHQENGKESPASRPVRQQHSEPDASNQEAQGAKDETNCCYFSRRRKSIVQSDSSDPQGSDDLEKRAQIRDGCAHCSCSTTQFIRHRSHSISGGHIRCHFATSRLF